MHTEEDVRCGLKDLPDTLKNAYDDVYNRILTQKRSAPGLALNAFRWIQTSFTPLKSKTLLDAISVSVGEKFSRVHTINANDLLQICQNLIVWDESLDVFRFAHLSADEYLETRLPKVDSHTAIMNVCLSILSNPSSWDGYDRDLAVTQHYDSQIHLLLYSTVFWPWHMTHCEDTNDIQSLWNTFTSGASYQQWLKYHRSVVKHSRYTSDLYWRRVDAWQRQGDDPLYFTSVFGLSRTFKSIFGSKSYVDKACIDQLLIHACEFGDLDIARLLIHRGTDVSATDSYGWTPLRHASTNGHKMVARLLIDSGADVSAADKYGLTPLHLASENGHETVALLLFDKGADVSAASRDGSQPLHLASENGHETVARLLIDRGADVSAACRDRWTPLRLASEYGHETVVRLLIDSGANVSTVDKNGLTPLHFASRRGHAAVAQLLISRGADVSAAEKDGVTPLHSALRHGQEAMAQFLIDRGADISAISKDGSTPLHFASRRGQAVVAQLLINSGADVSAIDSDGGTPLLIALRHGQKTVAQLLIDRGADVSTADKSG